MSERKLFGTDGVRGVANGENMTPELALQLGRALGAQIKRSSRVHQVVVGKDTRLSGYMIETALSSGLCSVGVDVWLCGPLPTPGIAFITHSMRADAGVVISASHNPYQDNGIKIFGHDGFKLPDEREAELEAMMASGSLTSNRPQGRGIGKAHRIDDAVGRYVAFLKTLFPKELDLSGVKLVVDAGHGAAYKVAPAVFSELGAEVIALGVDPDGININDGVGALHPDHMCRAVREHGADCGIALDGDADRVIIACDKGEVIDGDQLLAIFARELQASGGLRGGGVVATVMSNLGLEMSLADVGLKLHRTQVGDRYVVEAMRGQGFNLGGEQSGHIVYLDHATTGDGVVAALLLLSAARRTGKRVSELKRVIDIFPQILVNVKVQRKTPIEELATVGKAIAAAEHELGTKGRVLVRYSGTENKARVMIEGPDAGRVEVLAKQIAHELELALA